MVVLLGVIGFYRTWTVVNFSYCLRQVNPSICWEFIYIWSHSWLVKFLFFSLPKRNVSLSVNNISQALKRRVWCTITKKKFASLLLPLLLIFTYFLIWKFETHTGKWYSKFEPQKKKKSMNENHESDATS